MKAETLAMAQSGRLTIEGAESLLTSLAGVLSARIVARPTGEVEEIHLLTTEEVTPKQTVRNVESALLAHFGVAVDHRKISVARIGGQPKTVPSLDPTSSPPAAPADSSRPRDVSSERASSRVRSPSAQEERILFTGLQVESQRAHRVRFLVELEWGGERFRGEATGADLARARMETLATAALRAVEASAKAEETGRLSLALDGVKAVDAFDKRYALVSVTGFSGREVASLSGSALIDESPDKAVVLATLRATDRWVRGRAD